MPSEADELAGGGDEDELRRALSSRPGHAVARRELGRLLLRRGETSEALELLDGVAGDFVAEGLAARAQLAGDPELDPAFEAWDAGDPGTALEALQLALLDPERRDLVRRVMVAIFTELGADDPLAREHRRRLSAALFNAPRRRWLWRRAPATGASARAAPAPRSPPRGARGRRRSSFQPDSAEGQRDQHDEAGADGQHAQDEQDQEDDAADPGEQAGAGGGISSPIIRNMNI